MVNRWARPATVLNSYSLLTSLRQRAVNAGCMFAAFITLPYHCHESGTCSSKGKYFKHNDAVTRASVIKCKILKEVAEEVIGFHSRRQFNCSCDFQITRAVAKSQWYLIKRFSRPINPTHVNTSKRSFNAASLLPKVDCRSMCSNIFPIRALYVSCYRE